MCRGARSKYGGSGTQGIVTKKPREQLKLRIARNQQEEVGREKPDILTMIRSEKV